LIEKDLKSKIDLIETLEKETKEKESQFNKIIDELKQKLIDEKSSNEGKEKEMKQQMESESQRMKKENEELLSKIKNLELSSQSLPKVEGKEIIGDVELTNENDQALSADLDEISSEFNFVESDTENQ